MKTKEAPAPTGFAKIAQQLDEDMGTVTKFVKAMHPHAMPKAVDDAFSKANEGRCVGPFRGDGAWDTAYVTSATLAAGLNYASYPIVLPAAAALSAFGTVLAIGRAGVSVAGEGISTLATKLGIAAGSTAASTDEAAAAATPSEAAATDANANDEPVVEAA